MNYINQNIFKKGSKILKVSLLVFLLPLLIFMTSCESKIIKKYNIKIEGEIGYDGTVSINGGNPLKFSLSNEGANDFDGEIKILVPLNGKHMYEIVLPVEVAAGSKKTIEKSVHLGSITKYFEYELYSEGVKINKGVLRVNKFLDPKLPKVAIISDNADNYKFLSDMQLRKDRVETLAYDEEIATEEAEEIQHQDNIKPFIATFENLASFNDVEALQFFDYIFIGDVSNLSLTDEGEKQLLSWVKQGGVLIIESGKNFDKMNKQIPDEIRQVDFDSLKTVEHKLEPFVGKVQRAKGKIIRENTEEIIIDEITHGYIEKLGAGTILTINTLLNDGVVSNWNIKGIYLQSILETGKVSSEVFSEDSYYRSGSHRRNYMIENLPLSSDLPYELIAVILLVYVIIAAPILYLILKKKDKQVLMWVIAPAISIVVIIGISQIGYFVWGGKPILNEMSLITYVQGTDTLKVDSSLALFNNEKTDVKITWDSMQDASIEIDYYDYTRSHYGGIEPEDREVVASVNLGRNREYISYDKGLWEFVRASASKTIKIEDKGTQASYIGDEKGSGTIKFKNGLPFDFENAMIYRNNRYYLLGSIESGMVYEYKLDELPSATRTWDFDRLNRDESEIVFFDLVSDAFIPKRGFDELIILGYSDKPVGYELKINGEEPRSFARNLVMLDLDLEIPKNGIVQLGIDDVEYNAYVYNGLGTYEGIDGFEHYRNLRIDRLGGRFSVVDCVSDSLDLLGEYKISKNIKAKSIVINFNCNNDYNYDVVSDLISIGGEEAYDKYYIFNYKTNDYEEVIPDFTKNKDSEYVYGDDIGDEIDTETATEDGEVLAEKEVLSKHDKFLADRFYEIDPEKHISEDGIIKTKTEKSTLYSGRDYDFKPQDIIIKGVYK